MKEAKRLGSPAAALFLKVAFTSSPSADARTADVPSHADADRVKPFEPGGRLLDGLIAAQLYPKIRRRHFLQIDRLLHSFRSNSDWSKDLRCVDGDAEQSTLKKTSFYQPGLGFSCRRRFPELDGGRNDILFLDGHAARFAAWDSSKMTFRWGSLRVPEHG